MHNNERYTQKDYLDHIARLREGMTQLEPDGRNCAICHDNGHQAWECYHNPLNHSKRFWGSMTEWRCFHCNQVFVNEEEAEQHFGKLCDELQFPKCVVKHG